MTIAAREGGLDRVKTTVTLSLGTKNRLKDLGKKGESFDDIVSRLINTMEHDGYYREMWMEQARKDGRNLIIIDEYERGTDIIELPDGTVVRFTYNIPHEGLDEFYEMMIQEEMTIPPEEDDGDGQTSSIDPINTHLRMVARIIRNHFDTNFHLPMNRNIIDTRYWTIVRDRVRLPETSFRADILIPLNRYPGVND